MANYRQIATPLHTTENLYFMKKNYEKLQLYQIRYGRLSAIINFNILDLWKTVQIASPLLLNKMCGSREGYCLKFF